MLAFGKSSKSGHPSQKFPNASHSEIFYPLRSNGISSTHEVRRISSAPLGLYIITHQRAYRLRNDDIQHFVLVIYKAYALMIYKAYALMIYSPSD